MSSSVRHPPEYHLYAVLGPISPLNQIARIMGLEHTRTHAVDALEDPHGFHVVCTLRIYTLKLPRLNNLFDLSYSLAMTTVGR